MAVKTKFSTLEFTQILKTYDLGNLIRFLPISSGTVQTNYLLETTRGKVVFRYYENRSFEAVMFESDLLLFLKSNNFPCPGQYSNKFGEFVSMHLRKPYMIFEYIHGEHRDHLDQEQEKQLIITAANLHHLTKDYQSIFLPYRWNYGIELCQNLALDTARRINTENSWAKLEWYSNELSNLCLPDTLPKGICHSDFDVSNLMFRDGQFISLLDYDDANYTFLIFDLAGLMNPLFPGFEWDTWFQYPINQPILNFRKARWVVEEYNKNRPLIQEEKVYLFDVYKLSVLMDCIWYFERGNVNDFFEKRKIEALNKLGRENFYRELFEGIMPLN